MIVYLLVGYSDACEPGVSDVIGVFALEAEAKAAIQLVEQETDEKWGDGFDDYIIQQREVGSTADPRIVWQGTVP